MSDLVGVVVRFGAVCVSGGYFSLVVVLGITLVALWGSCCGWLVRGCRAGLAFALLALLRVVEGFVAGLDFLGRLVRRLVLCAVEVADEAIDDFRSALGVAGFFVGPPGW